MADTEPHVKSWETFWRNICTTPDGTLNLDAIQRELHDYWVFMGEASKVYSRITGGKITKINTCADVVVSVAEDYFSEMGE